jgi:hypothetical protein
MYLGNPSLPLKFSLKDSISIAEKKLVENNWNKFDKFKSKLVLKPFYYFNYHFFKEKIVDEQNVIESSVDGFLSLDAIKLKLDEANGKLIFDNLKEITSKAPEIEFVKLNDNIEKKELKAIINLKIAEYFHIPKQNIVVSSIKKCFLPVYELEFLLNEKKVIVKVNAATNEILNPKDIPFREKSISEITQETLEELTDPSSWIKYIKEIFSGTGSFFVGKAKKQKGKKVIKTDKDFFKVFSSKIILLLIIFLALFLIFLAFFN